VESFVKASANFSSWSVFSPSSYQTIPISSSYLVILSFLASFKVSASARFSFASILAKSAVACVLATASAYLAYNSSSTPSLN
jgi:hypothetical protein